MNHRRVADALHTAVDLDNAIEHRRDLRRDREVPSDAAGVFGLARCGSDNGDRSSIEEAAVSPTDCIDSVIGREGKYSNNPSRAFGYTGPTAQMPRDTAVAIYRTRYWTQPHFDQVQGGRLG